MGVSFVSMANARENLDKEQAGLTFDQIRTTAHDTWNSDLGKIRVKGGTDKQKEVFYTALYHTLIHPNVLNDVNGQYPLMESFGDGQISDGHDRYTVFSLWDTYRNLHQLMTLVYPERQTDMVRSMIDMSKEWGWLPKWELYGRETFTMEGDPAVPVIIDTWRKGLRDFDMDAAYAAMKKSATTPGAFNPMRPDIDPYIEKGYVPLGATCRQTTPATTRFRMHWNIMLRTMPWHGLQNNVATKNLQKSFANAPKDTQTIIPRKVALCARSIRTAHSSVRLIPVRAKTSNRFPDSTKDRHGTTRSLCLTMLKALQN